MREAINTAYDRRVLLRKMNTQAQILRQSRGVQPTGTSTATASVSTSAAQPITINTSIPESSDPLPSGSVTGSVSDETATGIYFNSPQGPRHVYAADLHLLQPSFLLQIRSQITQRNKNDDPLVRDAIQLIDDIIHPQEPTPPDAEKNPVDYRRYLNWLVDRNEKLRAKRLIREGVKAADLSIRKEIAEEKQKQKPGSKKSSKKTAKKPTVKKSYRGRERTAKEKHDMDTTFRDV